MAQPLPDASDTVRDDALRVIARGYGDSVVVRWAPADVDAWSDGLQYGYIVERVSAPGGFELGGEVLTPKPLIPWSRERWAEEYAADTSRRSLLAASTLLYEDYSRQIRYESDGSPASLASLGDIKNRQQRGVALLVSDYDPLVAAGMALRFVDREVRSGEEYVYRVRLARSAESSGHPFGLSGVVPVNGVVATPDSLLVGAAMAVGHDGAIEVRWNVARLSGYSGFVVEREEDSSWVRLNDAPVVWLNAKSVVSDTSQKAASQENQWVSFVDSNIVNYQSYRYRIRGIDPFAELSEGVVVEGEGRDLTPPPSPSGFDGEEVAEGGVLLSWKTPAVASDLAGYALYRGPEDDGPFRRLNDELLSPSTSSYRVEDAGENEPYYFLEAVDTAGNRARSSVILSFAVDRIPPAPPGGLKGQVDSLGHIMISWDRNTESDILGYRLFFANDSTDEFSAVTGHLQNDNWYLDSLRIQKADQRIYYRVIALDQRQNQSQPSELLVVRQPDLTPPDPPAFRTIRSTDSSIVLHWGRGIAQDVRQQVVLRREREGGDWREVARLESTRDEYEDASVVPGIMYEYSLISIDSSGLFSRPGSVIYAGALDMSQPEGVTGLTSTLNREDWQVELRWDYRPTDERPLQRFVIYRGTLTGGLERYVTVEPEARRFVDDRIDAEPVWRYAVRVETVDGLSRLSEVQIVQMR